MNIRTLNKIDPIINEILKGHDVVQTAKTRTAY